MAYFNHAFQQTFAPATIAASASGTNSAALPALQGAFLVDQTYDVATDAQLLGGKINVIFAMGSPLGSATGVAGAANDILGGNRFHGGYAESWKSKLINPNYVRFVGKQPLVSAVISKVTLDATGLCFPCAGPERTVRLDFKGEPVLRTLNRNGYKILGGDGICCAAGEAFIDPAQVFGNYAIQILSDPILSQFVDIKLTSTILGTPTIVTDSTTTTGNTRWEKQQAAIAAIRAFAWATAAVLVSHEGELVITDTSAETVFGNCSFDTRDHYESEPFQIHASELDEDGDPCTGNCITVVRVEGKEAETKGELVLRDVMMYQRYMQHPTNQGNLDSTRIREVEMVGPADGNLGITRANNYVMYYILHTVPRFNNPTGTFDNDQYLIKVAMPAVSAAWETTLAALSTGAGLGGTITDMSTSFLPGYTGN